MPNVQSNSLNHHPTARPQTYPVSTTANPGEPREFLRCRRCLLVQFRTVSGLCRRCGVALPPPPKLDFEPVSQSILALSKLIDSAVPQARGPFDAMLPGRSSVVGSLLGRKIRKLRRQRALTQEDMAERAGVPRTYLSRIENGRVLPGPTIVHRLAAALGTEVLDLLSNGRGPENSETVATPFWDSMVRYFSQLQPEQMALVVRTVHEMAGAISPVAKG